VEFQPMSPEEMQRTMQFLLHQQAKFDARLDRISEKSERIQDALVGLTGIVGRLAESQQETDRRFMQYAREFRKADARLASYIRKVETQLLELFERHLREDHGHRPS
jgi:hypothetical protein